jgi:hypothetical protein
MVLLPYRADFEPVLIKNLAAIYHFLLYPLKLIFFDNRIYIKYFQ